MRGSVLALAAALTACSSGPAPGRDETKHAGYVQTAAQLAELDRQADALFQAGRRDEAGALIEKGQPLENRLLAVHQPTLEALEAVSDLDDLYGRMLLSNHHYGWARLLFQKNLARWKHWTPETEETLRRWKQAEIGIADCDKHLTE